MLLGCFAYVPQKSTTQNLIALRRGMFVQGPSDSFSMDAPGDQPSQWPSGCERLTREIEVVQLIAEGFLNRKIGIELGISIKTVLLKVWPMTGIKCGSLALLHFGNPAALFWQTARLGGTTI
jgi:DNA-binding NarL/FixJ family response regulator